MFDRDPFTPDRIFCPGPTPVPRAAHVAAQESAAIYHRSEEFYRDFLRCTELLAPVFGSKGRPVILTCSGTGAMEATLVKLTEPGDEVVCVVGGKFGERWEQLARTRCGWKTGASTPSSPAVRRALAFPRDWPSSR
jgi:aspartate aminotransferase-like enzyme